MAPLIYNENDLGLLCDEFAVSRLSFFGSVLRPDFTTTSDVDVLVEFLPGQTPGFRFVELQERLAAILGRPVDLHTPSSLGTRIRHHVLCEAQVQFEHA